MSLALADLALLPPACLQRNGWQVVLSDRNPHPPMADHQAQLQQEGITVAVRLRLCARQPHQPGGGQPRRAVGHPGPWSAAREMGLEVIGEMELAWRFLEDRPWVGITGTNGKTTTTALTAAIFQAAGFDAPACGNNWLCGL